MDRWFALILGDDFVNYTVIKSSAMECGIVFTIWCNGSKTWSFWCIRYIQWTGGRVHSCSTGLTILRCGSPCVGKSIVSTWVCGIYDPCYVWWWCGEDIYNGDAAKDVLRVVYYCVVCGSTAFSGPVAPTIQMIDRLIQQYGPVYCVSEWLWFWNTRQR